MRKTTLLLLGFVQIGLIGCATVPDKSELTRVDGSTLEALVVGNTYTYATDYGRWADYVETRTTGYGRAWGSWGSENVTSTYTISADGEWCSVYAGSAEWSIPDYEYCTILYADAEGNHYSETITNPWAPEREGQLTRIEIKSGDAYGLKE